MNNRKTAYITGIPDQPGSTVADPYLRHLARDRSPAGSYNTAIVPGLTGPYDPRAKRLWMVDVSPEMAIVWLDRNVSNRRQNSTVADLAAAMAEGAWNPDSCSIRFDINGVLIDGQHRLEAVKESGCTVRMEVITGCDPEAKKHIDENVPRRLYERQAFTGTVSHDKRVAAILGCIYRLDGGRGKLRVERARDIYTRCADAIGWLLTLPHCKHRGLCRTPILVALMEMWQADGPRAAAFADRLYSGLNFSGSDDPAKRLRDLAVAKGQIMGRLGLKLTDSDLYAKAKSACHAELAGRTLDKLYAFGAKAKKVASK